MKKITMVCVCLIMLSAVFCLTPWRPAQAATGSGGNVGSAPATEERVASGIISDLRSMKAACLMLYFDRMDEFDNKTVTNITPEMIAIYLDHPDKFQSDESPYLTEITDEGKWWVGFDLKKAGTEDAVKEYLRERAESVGLCGAMDADVIYADQDVVWLMAQ